MPQQYEKKGTYVMRFLQILVAVVIIAAASTGLFFWIIGVDAFNTMTMEYKVASIVISIACGTVCSCVVWGPAIYELDY